MTNDNKPSYVVQGETVDGFTGETGIGIRCRIASPEGWYCDVMYRPDGDRLFFPKSKMGEAFGGGFVFQARCLEAIKASPDVRETIKRLS